MNFESINFSTGIFTAVSKYKKYSISSLQASETEILWVMRVSIFLVGGLATLLALTIPTVYGLW